MKFLISLSDIWLNFQNELSIKCSLDDYSSHPLVLTRGSGNDRDLRCNRGTTGAPELGRSALFPVCRGSGSGRGPKISLRFNTGEQCLNFLAMEKGRREEGVPDMEPLQDK